MGGGASKKKAALDTLKDDVPEKRWVEEKTFEAENSLVYSSSPLFNELRGILAEPLGQRFLGEFAKTENSSENFFAWIDMEEYKEIPTKDYRRCVARNIFQKYIKHGAVMQLGGITEDRIKHYENLIFDNNESPAQCTTGVVKTSRGRLDLKPDLFIGLQHMVFREMAENTFKRFKDSDKYKEYLEKKQATYNTVDVEDFDYLNFLGQGAFGLVAHVKKKSTGKEYAMKVMSKGKLVKSLGGRGTTAKRREKICMERDVYVNCNFPFLVSMHYAFQTEKEAIIVMEYARGGTLQDLMRSYPENRLPEDAVRFITAELMLALRHLHCSNYVHRDLKPINVLLDSDGHVKLADMGLVGRIDDTKKVVKELHSGAVLNSDSDEEEDAEDDDDEYEEEEQEETKADSQPSGKVPETPKKGSVISPEKAYIGRRYTKVGTMGYKAPELLEARRPVKPNKEGTTKTDEAPTSPTEDPPGNEAATAETTEPEADEKKAVASEEEKESQMAKSYGYSVDWWSLGVMVLEMFTGKNIYAPKASMIVTTANPEKVEHAAILAVQSPGEKVPNGSPEAKSFVNGLLAVDPAQRLGCTEAGFKAIQNHAWFKDMNLSKLLNKEISPPYKIPRKHSVRDEPRWGTFQEMRVEVEAVDINALMGETQDDTIQERHQKYFNGWDYVAPATFKLELGMQKDRQRGLTQANLEI